MPIGLKQSLPASFAILTDPGVRHAYNEAFVTSELLKFRPFFDDLDGRSLPDQQREACIRLEDNNLLVASAGSGKSATMVGKITYVLKKQLYRPDERQIEVENDDGTLRHLHPDFYYPLTGTVHEHFALNADGTSPFADYAKHAENKRQAYRGKKIDFFETTSAQADSDTLLRTLEAELTKRAVPLERKSYTEIATALEPVVIKHYHKLISTCIKHIRASHLTLEILLERVQTLARQGTCETLCARQGALR